MNIEKLYKLRFLYKDLNLKDCELENHHIQERIKKIKCADNKSVVPFYVLNDNKEFTLKSHISKIIQSKNNYSKAGAFKIINKFIKENNIDFLYYDLKGSKVYSKKDFNDLLKLYLI